MTKNVSAFISLWPICRPISRLYCYLQSKSKVIVCKLRCHIKFARLFVISITGSLHANVSSSHSNTVSFMQWSKTIATIRFLDLLWSHLPWCQWTAAALVLIGKMFFMMRHGAPHERLWPINKFHANNRIFPVLPIPGWSTGYNTGTYRPIQNVVSGIFPLGSDFSIAFFHLQISQQQ